MYFFIWINYWHSLFYLALWYKNSSLLCSSRFQKKKIDYIKIIVFLQDAHQQIKRGKNLLFWYLLLDKSSVTDTVIPSFKWQYKNRIEKEIKFSIPITKVSFIT